MLKHTKRVTIFQSVSQQKGKVFAIGSCFNELLEKASQFFGNNIKVFYSEKGAEINKIELIRDDEVLFVSKETNTKSLQKIDLNCKVESASYDEGDKWISLNVGGKLFQTTKNTLIGSEPDSMLAKMFAEKDRWSNTEDADGAILLDRSPQYFEVILNYLRHGQLILNKNLNAQGVLEEAKFFGLVSLIEMLEEKVKGQETKNDHSPLTRREVIHALLMSQTHCELRFQGMNFAGADLSKLDLCYVNFKLANLQGCNLMKANLYCCSFERADISHSMMDGANLQGAKMLCCNAEGSSMRGCNFDDPSGLKANMEGANMKGVNFEGSLMAGANLRVATLKNSNLKNCNLRGAVLAGTDLQNCDLSGCDLYEANLRGCNVDGTKFEEMITPLHMTQTVPP